VFCSVLQCVAMCCSVLLCAAVICTVLQYRINIAFITWNSNLVPLIEGLCCSIPYRIEISDYSVLRCVAVCCSMLQCVAGCCRVLQCVAVCCSVLQWQRRIRYLGFAYLLPQMSPVGLMAHLRKEHCEINHSRNLLHCITLQHTVTHCNTLQHTTTHCNTLQHTATHCNTLQHTAGKDLRDKASHESSQLQHNTTHCNEWRNEKWGISQFFATLQ